MSEFVRHQPQRLEAEQVRFISTTEFVPEAYRGNIPKIMACLAYGRELGIGDMEALQEINVIDGRPSMSANLMRKLVRSAGHSIQFEYGEESVTVRGKRADNGDEGAVTWTLAMAKRAGLLDKRGKSWERYPVQMLANRAVSWLCRDLFADCLRGLAYGPEELEQGPEDKLEELLAGSGSAVAPPHEGPDDSAFVAPEDIEFGEETS